MAADFNKPALDDPYVGVLDDIRDNDEAIAVMFNGVAVSNIPINAVQFAGGIFGLWNGSIFADRVVSVGGGGTGGNSAVAARLNLDLSSTAEANALYMKILSNGSDINDVSIFRTNIDVPSNAETLLVANDLSDINNPVTAFNNIKQGSTTIFSGTVIEATPAQMRAGTGNRFPDAATIVADRSWTLIWSGTNSGVVTDAEILVQTSFIVVPGRYIVGSSSDEFSVEIRVLGKQSIGTSKPSGSVSSPEFSSFSLIRSASNEFLLSRKRSGLSDQPDDINEIYFMPS